MNKESDIIVNSPKKWQLSTFAICGFSLFYTVSAVVTGEFFVAAAMTFLFCYELHNSYKRYKKVLMIYEKDDLMDRLLQIMQKPVIETHDDITFLNFIKPTQKIVAQIKYLESQL